jgi:hypothetical protein
MGKKGGKKGGGGGKKAKAKKVIDGLSTAEMSRDQLLGHIKRLQVTRNASMRYIFKIVVNRSNIKIENIQVMVW